MRSTNHMTQRLAVLFGATLLMASCSSGSSTTTSIPPGTTPSTAPVTTVPATTTSAPATTTTALATTTSTPPTATSSTTPEVVSLVLTPDGLVLETAGSSAEVSFGSTQADVIAAIEIALGPASEVNAGSNECPNGQDAVAVWDGIQVDFSEELFLSWFLRPGSSLMDEHGIGLGSSLADLELNYDTATFDSTLGPEFLTAPDLPAMGGLLSDRSGTATITNLWAGFICAFR